MKKILFQGDSITDGNRSKLEGDEWDLGKGYARFVTGDLGYKYPHEYEFVNKGVSGNRIVDVYARIKRDIINLKPDYMSLLIGVNDVWHEIVRKNGVDSEKFEKIYTMLIEEIKAALPDLKIIILAPYVLKGTGTEENWEEFKHEVALRAKTAEKIAKKWGFKLVTLQDKFDKAESLTNDASYWTTDGVHPTIAGHRLIANEWEKAFEEMK